MTSPPLFDRRRFLARSSTALGALALGGCGRESLLRVGANTWPGYELMFVAEQLGLVKPNEVRMVRMPSTTSTLQALASGQLDAAGLTLDEVLTARAEHLKLRIVSVIDISLGADVVLARPGLAREADFRGKRIICEQSAVGAVMLDAFLSAFGLKISEVTVSYATVNDHVDLYNSGQADLVVTFAPSAQAIMALGGQRIFDSAAIPGRIVDTLAVTEESITHSAGALRKLLSAYFEVLARLRTTPEQVNPLLAEGLRVKPAEVAACFEGMKLPDAMESRAWLQGSPPKLESSAGELGRLMFAAGLLPAVPDLTLLTADGFLPGENR